MDIFNQILTWPIIIQGALGSALFWIILVCGQMATRLLNRLLTKVRSDVEVSESFALFAWAKDVSHQERLRGFLICIYAAIHYSLKAVVVLTIAIFLIPHNYIFAAVGGIMALYFLFRALSYVPHSSSMGDTNKRLHELVARLTTKKGEDGS